MLPVVLFVGLGVVAIRSFPLLDTAALPYILAGIIALVGVAIAGGVYAGYKMSLAECVLRDELDNAEGRVRALAARVVIFEDERREYDRAVFNVDREVERRTYVHQRQVEELQDTLDLATNALQDSEDRWIRLIENHPEGVLVSAGRRILYANPSAVEILGARTAEDVTGTDLLRYSPQSAHDQLASEIAAAETGASQDPIQYPILALDGVERYVEAFGVQIDFRGAPAIQLVMRDITMQRDAERTLRKFAERLAVVNEIEKNILLAKRPGEVADHALAQLVRLVPCARAVVLHFDNSTEDAEVVAAHSLDAETQFRAGNFVDHGTTAEAAATSVPRHIRSLSIQNSLTPLDRAFADEGIDELFEAPLVVKGFVVGQLIVGREKGNAITDNETEIVREIADLISLVFHQHKTEQERISYEKELVSARDNAEEMVRLKTAFLTNMSHEIRTPLTGIIGFAQILGEEIDSEHGEFANLIENSGRRLLDTINSVLDLARLESNRMQMTLEPINIVDEAKRSVQLLTPLADKKGLTLSYEGSLNEVWLELDSAGLDRIFNNLIGNAIKFTSEGGITVSVQQSPEKVELIVADTGIGMSKEFLPLLFEEFRQESSGADRSHEGSGMGLSITRKLVEIMGGTVEVDSEKGVGTTFTVVFPVNKPTVSMAPDRAPVQPDRYVSERQVVLVVEDQEEARFLLQYVLHASFDIRLAPDMAVAAEIARSTDVAAMLLDVHLGGSQASHADITRYRKTDTFSDVPIIGMTAYPWPVDKSVVLGQGYDDFVSRPFEKEIVCGILEKHLDRDPKTHPVRGADHWISQA